MANRVLALMKTMPDIDQPRRVLIMGATFKENCPDIRNSKVLDVIQELESKGVDVAVIDPLVDIEEQASFGSVGWLTLNEALPPNGGGVSRSFDAVILAVPHDEFSEVCGRIHEVLRPEGILLDVKGVLPKSSLVTRL